MAAARVAQGRADRRGRGEHVTHRGILRIEDAKRAGLGLVPAIVVELRSVICEKRSQPLDVGRPAGAVADRVELEPETLDPKPADDLREQLDQLGIDRRVVRSDRLEIDLPELAVASLLGSRVPEHRCDAVGLHRLGRPMKAVFDIGARYRGRRLGS